jgi:hypothetical protein
MYRQNGGRDIEGNVLRSLKRISESKKKEVIEGD